MDTLVIMLGIHLLYLGGHDNHNPTGRIADLRGDLLGDGIMHGSAERISSVRERGHG